MCVCVCVVTRPYLYNWCNYTIGYKLQIDTTNYEGLHRSVGKRIKRLTTNPKVCGSKPWTSYDVYIMFTKFKTLKKLHICKNLEINAPIQKIR